MTLRDEVDALGAEIERLTEALGGVRTAYRRVNDKLQNTSLDEFEEDGPTTGGSGMQATVNET